MKNKTLPTKPKQLKPEPEPLKLKQGPGSKAERIGLPRDLVERNPRPNSLRSPDETD